MVEALSFLSPMSRFLIFIMYFPIDKQSFVGYLDCVSPSLSVSLTFNISFSHPFVSFGRHLEAGI